MADENDKTTKQAKGSRDDRLKSALRENLKRRKAQARGRTDKPDDEIAPDAGNAGKTDDEA